MFQTLRQKLRRTAPRRASRLHVETLEIRLNPSLDQVFDPEAVTSQFYFATSVAYFNTDQEEAQTFTVGTNGILSQVDLYISRFTPNNVGDLIVDIRGCQADGRPTSTGGPLASVTVPAATVPDNPTVFFAIDFSAQNLFVTSGEKLAVVLHVANDPGADVTYYWGGRQENYYSGGGHTGRLIGNSDWSAVDPVNDLGFKTYVNAPSLPPDVTLPGGPIPYLENAAPTVLSPSATVTDSDSADFDNGTLTVSFAINGTVDDRLAIQDQGTGAGMIGVTGNTVSYEGTAIGTFSGGVGTTPLMVHLNANATATATQVLVANLTYENVSDNPSTAGRTVQVILNDGDGGTSTPVSTTVNVQAVNDPPSLITNAGLTAALGASTPITQIDLKTTDVDNPPNQLFYTVTVPPAHGTIRLGGLSTFTFTQADINNGFVTYQQDGSTAFTDSFSFTVSDGSFATSSTTFAITITASNWPPAVTTNAGLTVAEGGSNCILASNLQATDPDNLPSDLTFTVATGPAHGLLLLNGNPVSTFTQADINAGTLVYANDGSESLTDTFTFTVSDGLLATGSTTFAINVTPTNDAPTLMTNAGLIVVKGGSAVIGHAALDTADPDDTSSQLVYTISAGPAHGTLQASGQAVTTFSQADLDAGRISYVNDGSAAITDGFTFIVNDGTVATNPATFAIAVDTVPQVTLSPQSTAAFAGSPVTLTAAATAIPAPSVQWQVKASGGSFVDIPGATSATFAFLPAASDDGNQYQAVFTNPVGSATTTAATLTVIPGLAILSEPASQTVPIGQTATFTASATGSTKTAVQWQVSTDGGATYTNIKGAKKTTLSVAKVSAAQDGAFYRAVFRNATGQAPSAAATLTVNYTVTLAGKRAIAVRPGTAVTLAVQAKTKPTAVQWQMSTDSAHTWVNIAAATAATYTYVTVSGASGYQFRAMVTIGTKMTPSPAVTLTVLDAPVVTLSPTNQSAPAGQSAMFMAAATGTGLKVQWQVSTDGGNTFTNLRGATKTTLMLKKVTIAMNGNVYRAAFADAAGMVESGVGVLSVM